MMLQDLPAMVAVMAILIVLLFSLKWYQTKFAPHPEIARKLLHIIMGCVTITFPWVFSSAWSVGVLAVIAALTLYVLKHVRAARESIGTVFCSVKRDSVGEICFPLAVAILFALSSHHPVYYCIAIGILTLSDTLSAFIGIFCGKRYFSTKDGLKTAEGSMTFFVSAACLTYLVLHFFTPNTAGHCLAIALTLACLVTAFEAISWKGLDNLFIPLSTYGILKMFEHLTPVELSLRLAVAVVLLAFAVLWRKRTTLDDSAAIGAGLFAYLSWAIGGWEWLVAPLTVFATYRWMLPRIYQNKNSRDHSIVAVIAVSAVGFFWLFFGEMTGHREFLFAYTLSYAAHLAAIAVAHMKCKQITHFKNRVLWMATLRSWLLFFAPYVLIQGLSQKTAFESLIGLVVVFASTLTFHLIQRQHEEPLSHSARWTRQIATAASSSAFTLLWAGFF